MTARISVLTLVALDPDSQGKGRILSCLPHGDTDFRVLRNMHDLQGCSSSDLLWALPHSTLTNAEVKLVAVRFATFCARKVLPLFEETHPRDNRPRRAIESAEYWIATGQIPTTAVAQDADRSAKTTRYLRTRYAEAAAYHSVYAAASAPGWAAAHFATAAQSAAKHALGLGQDHELYRKRLNTILQEAGQ